MLQYKVPQNVGIEDKIVGPLTLRQLIILAVGGGISYVLFSMLSKLYELNFIEYIVIAIPLLIAAAFALIRIHDIAFPKFLLLTLEFAIKPKKRVWDHRGITSLIDPDLSEKKGEKKQESETREKKNVNLRDLSRVLDSGGFNHLKVKTYEKLDQAEDQDLVAEAFFGHQKDPAQAMYWRAAKRDRGQRLTLLAKLPPTPVKQAEPIAMTTPPKPGVALAPSASTVASATGLAEKSQKKRRRRKKKKELITRPGTTVNTIDKTKPALFRPESEAPLKIQPEPTSSPPPKPEQKGEFEFKELQRGEIEINLD